MAVLTCKLEGDSSPRPRLVESLARHFAALATLQGATPGTVRTSHRNACSAGLADLVADAEMEKARRGVAQLWPAGACGTSRANAESRSP